MSLEHTHRMPSLKFHQDIYSYQIDFSRHVNNAVYINWLEIARVKVCDASGYSLARMATLGVLPVLVETQIAYKKPLLMGDVATIEVWIEELAGATAWMAYEITNQNGEVCATARQRGLWMDEKSGRPIRFDADMRAAFAHFEREATSES